ncbi:transposable element Tcb1 transposase [Trichonephila clavipes]|nr:transposable element Tcb1 transposase [Trichonephila clavipes]
MRVSTEEGRKDSGLLLWIIFQGNGSRVGRNQTSVMWILDRWMQEGMTDRRDRSIHLQCTTLREDRQILQRQKSLHHEWGAERSMWVAEWNKVVFSDERHSSLRNTTLVGLSLETPWGGILNRCVMHRYTAPASGIMVFGGIGYHSPTTLVRIAGT